MPVSRDKLDAERARERELYALALDWLRARKLENGMELGHKVEFIATVVASVPEILNVIQMSVDALQDDAANPGDEVRRAELVHVLRWQLGEALLRCLSLETPPGITWITVLDVVAEWQVNGTDAISSSVRRSLSEPRGANAAGVLHATLLELQGLATEMETTVQNHRHEQLLGSTLQTFYLHLLETLATAERVISQLLK